VVIAADIAVAFAMFYIATTDIHYLIGLSTPLGLLNLGASIALIGLAPYLTYAANKQ
jgi:hypothetical protein